MRDAVIVTAVRTPAGKAFRGAYRTVRPDTLAIAALRGALERTPGLDPAEIDEVIIGCSFPEAEQGMNVARQVVLGAGLPESVPGVTVNRFCSSGLQSIDFGAQAIMSGMADVVLAGGAESMTRIQGPGTKFMPDPDLLDRLPDSYLGNGLTAEKVAERHGVGREEQDRFALESHRRALAAQTVGRFDAELVPVTVTRVRPAAAGASLGETVTETFLHSVDEGPRPDTTLEALAALKPAFRAGGSVTAANSSQMSDGAAVAVLMSGEKAAALGIEPVVATPKALRLAGIEPDQVDLIELNEAFAGQAVYVMRELGLDPERVNPNGGAIALVHPLGCTGAKLTATLLHEMARRRSRYGIVSMCIAGGMGAAGLFENLRR